MSSGKLSEKIDNVVKQFLCNIPIQTFIWNNIFEDLTYESQQILANRTVNSSLIINYQIETNYQKSFLKYLIQKLEEHNSEVHDDLYSAYGRLVALPSRNEYFKHYSIKNGKNIITLKENIHLISDGTTGLRTWQEVANTVQENPPIMLHNGTMDVGVQDKTMKLTSTPGEKGRISWSKEEKKLVEDKAKFYFENFESPTMKFCTSLAKEPVLKRRSVTTVKAYIMNEIKRRKTDALILTPRPKCKRGVKKFWTEQEKEKVFEIFQENLQSKKLPSLAVCRKVISEHKIFTDRTPAMLKTCISNMLKKNDFMPI